MESFRLYTESDKDSSTLKVRMTDYGLEMPIIKEFNLQRGDLETIRTNVLYVNLYELANLEKDQRTNCIASAFKVSNCQHI